MWLSGPAPRPTRPPGPPITLAPRLQSAQSRLRSRSELFPMLRPHTSVLRIPVTTWVTESPVPHSNPTFFSDLTCPCPFTAPTLALAPSRLSLSAGSGSLYQPRHSPGAPGPAPSLSSLLRPAPHGAYCWPTSPISSRPLRASAPPRPTSHCLHSPPGSPIAFTAVLPVAVLPLPVAPGPAPAKDSPVPAPSSPTDDVHVLKADAPHTPALHGPG